MALLAESTVVDRLKSPPVVILMALPRSCLTSVAFVLSALSALRPKPPPVAEPLTMDLATFWS